MFLRSQFTVRVLATYYRNLYHNGFAGLCPIQFQAIAAVCSMHLLKDAGAIPLAQHVQQPEVPLC